MNAKAGLAVPLLVFAAFGASLRAAEEPPAAAAASPERPAQPSPDRRSAGSGRAWWAPVADRGWLGIRLSSKRQLEAALASENLPDEWIAVPNTRWLDEEWDGIGALVLEVFADSPAEKAGLLAGDVILSFSGVRTGSAGELVFVVQRAVRGHDADLEVLRDGEVRRVLVEVGLHPEDARRLEEEAAAKRLEAKEAAPEGASQPPAQPAPLTQPQPQPQPQQPDNR